jgi:hypothetical protein
VRQERPGRVISEVVEQSRNDDQIELTAQIEVGDLSDRVIDIADVSWVPQLVERSRCLDACLGAGIGLSACWEPCV